VPGVANSFHTVLHQHTCLAVRIEELLENHPLFEDVTCAPEIGHRAGARILIDVGDGTDDPRLGLLDSK
jgi:hypothetical protein